MKTVINPAILVGFVFSGEPIELQGLSQPNALTLVMAGVYIHGLFKMSGNKRFSAEQEERNCLIVRVLL